MRNITKTFPGVIANDRVTLEVGAGEVHALLGENGAGKTTLMHILYGIYPLDAGEILIRGRPVRLRSPRHAIALGIGLVPQHFLLIRRHTVMENIALGLPTTRFLFPLRRVEQQIRTLAERYGLAVDPQARIWQLSAGEQQRVEILKALIRGADILILDEPTGVLTSREARTLFQILKQMKAQGHAIIFITHKLDEVMEIADRITVLRKGRVVAMLPKEQADPLALARLMVGREILLARPKSRRAPGDPVLKVANLWAQNDRGAPALRGVSFTVHHGEILGVAGVAGNGQRELSEVITGLRPPASGLVHVLGQEMTGASARKLFEVGVAYIPEDRMHMGIVPPMSVAENLVLRRYRYPPFACGPVVKRGAVAEFAQQAITAYGIATTSPDAQAKLLSGGNVQRLILARELSGQPRLIVAAHPTYGLDVGATEQIDDLLRQQQERGAAILLISEDLEEIFRLSDRIMVMCAGEVMDIVPAAEADQEQIGLMMAGVHHR